MNTRRLRYAIASAAIRPRSAATGEQLLQSTLTKKHKRLAGLLGQQLIENLFEERSENSKFIDSPVYGEDSDSNVAMSKALHREELRNLSRVEQLKELLFPYRVGVYEQRDAYGGHEEGGWWYTTGTLAHESRPFMTKRGAVREELNLQKKYPKLQGQRSITSVSPSDAYAADVDQGVFEPQTYTDHTADIQGMPSTFVQESHDEDYDYSHFGQSSKDYVTRIYRGKPASRYPYSRPDFS
jgi:hypothetical protein